MYRLIFLLTFFIPLNGMNVESCSHNFRYDNKTSSHLITDTITGSAEKVIVTRKLKYSDNSIRSTFHAFQEKKIGDQVYVEELNKPEAELWFHTLRNKYHLKRTSGEFAAWVESYNRKPN
jgi:hypothetical protein